MWYIWAITLGPFEVLYRCLRFAVNSFTGTVGGSVKMISAIRRWRNKPKPIHGDARYADDKTLRKLGHLDNSGFLMGVTQSGKRVFTNPERSSIIMAPPGTGKSQHFIAALRAILERPDDRLPFLIIGDADGELYRATSKLMQARGYNVLRVDAVEPDEWTKYDILSDIVPPKVTDPNNENRWRYDRALEALCKLLVPDEPHSKQPHFVEFARLLLKCVITVNIRYEGNNKPIGELVNELISEEKRADLFKRSKKYGDEVVTAALGVMGKMGDKPEGLSMISTSLRKLDAWNDAAVKELTNYGTDMHGTYTRGWNFQKFFTQDTPMVLFVRTGIDKAGGDSSRVIYGNAINTVAHIRNKTAQPLKRELEVFLDEAGLTGYCEPIEIAYGRQRKAGVRVRMCFLSMKEFKKTYVNAGDMWNGSDVVVFGGGKDTELAKEISELAGEYTIENKGRSQGDHGESKSLNEQARKLVKPDEIRGLAYQEELMLMDNIVAKGVKPWRKASKRWWQVWRKPASGIDYL